jgi:type I restriction enzyme, S subunit
MTQRLESIPLGEIVKIHYGKALKKEERDESGSFVVYGSSGFIGRHSKNLANFPTIIIGCKGSVGAITFAASGGWTIDTAFYVEPIQSEKIDLRYLYYALVQANLSKHTITTSIPGLNRDDIYSTKIYLPPLEQQRRIAAILDKADELRGKRRQAIEKLEKLLQSVFLELFGDPVTNPKGWDLCKAGNVIESIEAGSSYGGEQRPLGENELGVLKSAQ